MKNFIRYGLSLIILLFLIGFILTWIIESEQGPGIFIISVMLFLILFIPIVLINKINNKEENILNKLNYIGLIGIIIGVTALIFRMFHWPGGSVIGVIGTFVFTINYLPFWFYYQWKTKSTIDKYFYLIFCSALGLLLAHYLFKTQHWPWANKMGYLSAILFGALLIYFFIVKKIIKTPNFSPSVKQQFIFGFMLAYVLSGIQNNVITYSALNSVSTGYENAEKNAKAFAAKNNFIYDAFTKTIGKDSTSNQYYLNAQKLNKQSKGLTRYLKKLRTFLIAETEDISLQVADTMLFDRVSQKINRDVTTINLIGNVDYDAKIQQSNKTIQDTNSAVYLKHIIHKYLDTIISLVPEESKMQIKQSLTIDLSDVKTEQGTMSWEVSNFNYVSLSAAYTTLVQLEADIRYIEQIVLNDLFNKANSKNKNNIAAQLADLSMKYETEKKEKEISLLQKDKELNTTRLDAKDAEINQTKKTISIFVIVLIIVSILILFVIRANYLRKKANTLLQKQKDEIELKNHLIEHQKQEIVDSVNYAQRIQKAILPEQDSIYAALKQSFIVYQPKDIVSGDFYFFHSVNSNHHILAACDCTGHGVPGAFMSLIGSNVLKQVVIENNNSEPAQILNEVNKGICDTLKQNQNQNRDGMDVAIISLENNNTKTILKYAGANRPLWLIRNNELIEIKPDKNPIGGFQPDEDRKFTQHELELHSNDTLYIFSDGFADQFGGEQGKKMMTKRFKEIILSMQEKSMQAQHNELCSHYGIWKGQHEQVDDVLVIGVRI